MRKSELKAQCKHCHRILYGDKWLYGKMSITLFHIAQVDCPDCAAIGAGINKVTKKRSIK